MGEPGLDRRELAGDVSETIRDARRCPEADSFLGDNGAANLLIGEWYGDMGPVDLNAVLGLTFSSSSSSSSIPKYFVCKTRSTSSSDSPSYSSHSG